MACDMSLIRVVSEQVSCAAQPDEAWLELLSLSGTSVIINLGLEDAEYALANESTLVKGLGMTYHNIPVAFDAPQQADYHAFCSQMEACGEQRILVHCAANKRASCFVALWMERQGWSVEQGDHLINSVWQPDTIWSHFIAEVREAQAL